MLKLFSLLFLQFFQIGVFSFGGGYATLPFLCDIAEKFHWYTMNQLTNMLAISSVTPGPIGINMATFAGYNTAGIMGAIIATIAITIPSLVIVLIISKILKEFKTNKYVSGVVKTLKPTGCALLSAVGIKLIFTSNLHLFGALILLTFIITSFIKKREPLFYLGLSAIIGLVAGYFHMIGV